MQKEVFNEFSSSLSVFPIFFSFSPIAFEDSSLQTAYYLWHSPKWHGCGNPLVVGHLCLVPIMLSIGPTYYVCPVTASATQGQNCLSARHLKVVPSLRNIHSEGRKPVWCLYNSHSFYSRFTLCSIESWWIVSCWISCLHHPKTSSYPFMFKKHKLILSEPQWNVIYKPNLPQ